MEDGGELRFGREVRSFGGSDEQKRLNKVGCPNEVRVRGSEPEPACVYNLQSKKLETFFAFCVCVYIFWIREKDSAFFGVGFRLYKRSSTLG